MAILGQKQIIVSCSTARDAATKVWNTLNLLFCIYFDFESKLYTTHEACTVFILLSKRLFVVIYIYAKASFLPAVIVIF